MKSSKSDFEARLPKLRIFNPSRLSDAELEASFIVHQTLFEKLLNQILNEKKGHVPQHHLIVGQRGMGKTTMLCRLAVELRKPEFCGKYMPLQFPEEQYVEVDRLSKFWLNCLDSFADALEEEGDLAAVQNLDLKIRSLNRSSGDEGEVAREAQKLFEAIVKASKRRPVLLFDNFHLLLERLKEDDYTLRAFFMREDAPILIGASTAMPSDTSDYGAAFYDAFMIHLLHRLSLQEMQEVLKRLAAISGNAELTARIYQETPRLATLRDLTGGNPRTTVLLFELFACGFSKDAYEDLESLLDQMTPLYQSRLEQLSEQSQLVLGALARNWSPASALQLTELTSLPRGSISTQLNRLEAIGMVEKVELSKGKKPGYQVAERFFNIWYLMRFAARRQRSDLIFLTRFLQEFYTPVELRQRAHDLVKQRRLSQGELTYAMALAETGLDATTAYELKTHAETTAVWEGAGVLKSKRIASTIDPSDISEEVYSFEEIRRKLKERVIESGATVDPDEFVDLVMGSFDLLPPNKPNRLDLIERKLEAREVESLYAKIQEQRKAWAKVDESPVVWIEERLRRGLITHWDNTEQIQNALDTTNNYWVCILIASISWALAEYELTTKAYEAALKIKPDAEEISLILALIYRDVFDDPQKARVLFTSVSEFETCFVSPHLKKINEVLFASREQNWGQAQKHLSDALDLTEGKTYVFLKEELYWASSVLLHQGYGVKLIKFLDEESWSIRLRPWAEAIRAHALENRRYLLDIPQESREVAGDIYDQIAKIRQHLPESTRNLFTK
jgi:hypothetical protein